MKQVRPELRIYTVVDVWRGIAIAVKNFTELKCAQNYVLQLRRCRNMQEDDQELFENSLRLPLPNHGTTKRSRSPKRM